MKQIIEGALSAEGRSIAIVQSRFNSLISERLTEAAVDCILRHGGSNEGIRIVKVPGAFEIPLVAKKLAMSGRFNAVICLGAIIRGATPHFDYIAGQVTGSLGAIACETLVPIVFGVLTTDSIEQAIERAGTKAGNKGWDAAMTALEMISVVSNVDALS